MEPILYTKINRQQLERLLECLFHCLELPVRALDEEGNVLYGLGTSTSFCSCFKKLLPRHSTSSKDSCREIHADAGKRAMKAGGAYVFSCHANMNHLIFPLNVGKQQLGSILIGPFLTQAPDLELILDIAVRYSLNAREVLELSKTAESIQQITPEKAEQTNWLMAYLFSPLLSPEAGAERPAASPEASAKSALSAVKGTDAIKNAVQYMTENYNHPLTLKETACYADLNPSYFSTLFKQTCGSTFKEYLNLIRIEESKKLLKNTSFPVIDIAIAVGFEDQSYFTKVFKKFTNMTPKQYRDCC